MPHRPRRIEMAATPQAEQAKNVEHQQREQLKALIREQVMSTLGQPGDLHLVQVRPLWPDHYRVNILVGENAASAKVAHSYFLVADTGGNISAATPAITRQYQKDQACAT